MQNSIKYIWIILISTFTTICINMDTSIEVGMEGFTKVASIIYVVEAILFGILLNKVLDIKNRRLKIIACIISSILATFEIVGFSINTYLYLAIPAVAIFKWLGYFIIFACVVIWLYNLIDTCKNPERNSKLKNFLNSKKSIIVIALIIFILWVPYLIKYYPGVVTSDSIDQIYQTIGINTLINHHPIFHTMIISVFIGIGNAVGNINFGVGLYSIFQMLVMSTIFAFTIYYLNKKNVPIWITVCSFIFFAFYPVMPMYGMTMWKDILFGGAMLLYTIGIAEMVINREKFLNKPIYMIALAVIILLVQLLRNNGIYIIVLSIPFIILFNRKYWKKLLLIFVMPVVFYLIITGPLFKLLNIPHGSIVEALSIPIQQLTRVAKYDQDTLAEEDYQLINKYIRLDEVEYDPRLSDNAKWHMNDDVLDENKGEFFGLWFKLFFQYPVEYIESFLCNSYGYWYPEAHNWVVSTDLSENEIGIKRTNQSNFILLNALIDHREIPVTSMIFSIGFAVWISFLSLMYLVYRKDYKYLQIHLGIIFLWLTVIASPVYCEYRYIFSLFTCLPILMGVSFMKKNVQIEK